MKVLKHFNDISKELLETTKLKKDQIVKYRVHTVGVGKRKVTPLMPMVPAIPSAKNVPPTDQIFDPFKGEKGEFVTIGAIRNVKSNGNPGFYDLTFRRSAGGIIQLRGGRVADQEIHSFMMLTDFNGSKPDRDTSKPILFTFINEDKIASDNSLKRNNLRIALNAAADLTEENVRIYTAARGLDDKRKLSILRDELENFAATQSDDFMKFLSGAQTTVNAVVHRALKNNKIKFDKEQSRFEWPTGEPILTVARTGQDAIEEFALWLRQDLKGEKVFQLLNVSDKKPIKNSQQA